MVRSGCVRHAEIIGSQLSWGLSQKRLLGQTLKRNSTTSPSCMT
jgi:hypothetical protein